MYDAAAAPVLVDERQIGARIGRQCGGAPTEDDWPDEQGQLVDQAGDESLRCHVRAQASRRALYLKRPHTT